MPANLPDLNVLVVDDENSVLRLIRMVLADFGVTQVFTAKDGAKALALLGSFDDIDIVICDWNMPGMSGLGLLQQVRTVDRDIPFIMLTGRADLSSVMEARDFGVSDYLVKPFTPEKLEGKLLRLAQARQASR